MNENMFQAHAIIFAIFSMLFSNIIIKAEAQTPLNSPAAPQVFNGLVTAPASSQSTDFGTTIGSSPLQSSSNSFIPGPAISQSASNSFPAGTSTSLAASDYLQQHPIITDIDIPDPSIELFAHIFSFGLLSMDALKPYSSFELCKPHDIFLLLGKYVLLKAKIDYPYIAEVVANSGDAVGSVSSSLFFDTLGVILAKFLFSKGLLTISNAFSLAQTALNLIKIDAESQGVFDIESMMKSIANGLYDFVNSFGLISRENLSQIFNSFAEVIQDLSTGIDIVCQ